MQPAPLNHGDVVQIAPHVPRFGGCFMLVTELKSFGAMGFISVPHAEEKPGAAYFRCKFEDMEFIGKSFWAPSDDSNHQNPEDGVPALPRSGVNDEEERKRLALNPPDLQKAREGDDIYPPGSEFRSDYKPPQ